MTPGACFLTARVSSPAPRITTCLKSEAMCLSSVSSKYLVRTLTMSLVGGKLAAMRAAADRLSSLRNSSTTASLYSGAGVRFSSALNSATTKAVPLTSLICDMQDSTAQRRPAAAPCPFICSERIGQQHLPLGEVQRWVLGQIVGKGAWANAHKPRRLLFER